MATRHPIINNKKICNKCLKEKELICFWFENRINDYHGRCKDCVKEQKEKYINSNKEKVALAAKKRGIAYNKRRNELRRLKTQQDSIFLVEKRHRNRIWKALTKAKTKKEGSSVEYLGCTYNYFRDYIESLFLNGMNWENRNLWDIDHIIPICSFDLTKEEELYKCFHHSNMRPL